jgi:pyruvate formate-lyase activating enzyme-like uncharacterized protein
MKNRQLSDVFERYALGLARKDSLPEEKNPVASMRRKERLMGLLKNHGIKGWPERGTLFTKNLSSGCKPCLEGRASHLSLTTLCSRECFFCFNPKPRRDVLSVHGREADSLDEACADLKKLGVQSVGIGGGEPTLFPKRVLEAVAALRKNLGDDIWIDLYTNGDRLNAALLKDFRTAGIKGLRINLAARNYDTTPVSLALKFFEIVEIEMPAIPEDKKRVRSLILELDKIGVNQLILHELFASAANLDALKKKGFESSADGSPNFRLTWSPVAKSEGIVLGHLLYALLNNLRMSLYYCSCRTQDWIAENALKNAALTAAP